jgi:hypothetical protein
VNKRGNNVLIGAVLVAFSILFLWKCIYVMHYNVYM